MGRVWWYIEVEYSRFFKHSGFDYYARNCQSNIQKVISFHGGGGGGGQFFSGPISGSILILVPCSSFLNHALVLQLMLGFVEWQHPSPRKLHSWIWEVWLLPPTFAFVVAASEFVLWCHCCICWWECLMVGNLSRECTSTYSSMNVLSPSWTKSKSLSHFQSIRSATAWCLSYLISSSVMRSSIISGRIFAKAFSALTKSSSAFNFVTFNKVSRRSWWHF